MMFRTVLVLALMCVFYVSMAAACVGHDGACSGANGSQGDCCGGMHCQKNDPSWEKGRCYYNPGKK